MLQDIFFDRFAQQTAGSFAGGDAPANLRGRHVHQVFDSHEPLAQSLYGLGRQVFFERIEVRNRRFRPLDDGPAQNTGGSGMNERGELARGAVSTRRIAEVWIARPRLAERRVRWLALRFTPGLESDAL